MNNQKRMSEDYSDWRSDLIEVSGYSYADKADVVPTKGKKSEERDKEITVKKINNKILINPNMREEFASIGAEVIEVSEIDEKINMRTADVGEVVKDFYKSDAPQFKGKSKEKRRQMAIAAKLEAEEQNEEFTVDDVIEFLVTEGYVWDRDGAEKMLEEASETELELVVETFIKEGLSIDDQMKMAREAAKKRNPNPDHKAIRAKMMKKPLPKDTRTDAQKMTDATGPRPGSRYRGD
jgi:SOS response regulatory protein OraA/RecX